MGMSDTETTARLTQLGLYQDDWDGMGAKAPEKAALDSATAFYERFWDCTTLNWYVFPLVCGGVQLEVQRNDRRMIEFEFLPDGICEFYRWEADRITGNGLFDPSNEEFVGGLLDWVVS